MIRHYLKITWREFIKDRGYTLIKIGGLALAIAACLLIMIYIKGELGYDNFYKNNNRIYRVVGATDLSGHWERWIHFQAPFAKALMDEIPEVELAGRINNVELFGAGSNQIRKVSGAKIIDILSILNKEFLIWILLSFFIATPLSWLLMNKYLQDYAYKTEISWWMFAFTGILVLGIALMTVSWQSWCTARKNPVEALKYE